MEKQEFKSKWDELAREIGAEILPEVQQREEAASSAPPETAAPVNRKRETPPVHAPVPKRNAANWDGLASDLGLPPVESKVPPAQDIAPVETRPEPRPRQPNQSRTPEKTERERRPRRESSERGREPREGREKSEHRRDHRPERRDDRPKQPERERERELKAKSDEGIEPPPTSREPASEMPQKPANVSLWHKIFGLPAEQSAKRSDEPSSDAPVISNDLRDEPRSAGSGFADAHADEVVRTQEDLDELNDAGGPSTESDEPRRSDRGRGRSRGRRGRGRGRGSEERPAESRSRERPRDSKPPTLPKQEVEDEFADDEFADDNDSEDLMLDEGSDTELDDGVAAGASKPRSASALQRTIPSWDEAIGFIVDSNMQSRSQRRPPSRPGSRDNQSRGRSRGRRKN